MPGQRQGLPFFKEVQVDDPWLVENVLTLQQALTGDASPLESESRFTWSLVQMIRRYADIRFPEQRLGRERKAIQQARCYIEECFAEGINLTQLAEYVSLSPYYLLRVFRAEVGMPPYSYLESVRIRQAQR